MVVYTTATKNFLGGDAQAQALAQQAIATSNTAYLNSRIRVPDGRWCRLHLGMAPPVNSCHRHRDGADSKQVTSGHIHQRSHEKAYAGRGSPFVIPGVWVMRRLCALRALPQLWSPMRVSDCISPPTASRNRDCPTVGQIELRRTEVIHFPAPGGAWVLLLPARTCAQSPTSAGPDSLLRPASC